MPARSTAHLPLLLFPSKQHTRPPAIRAQGFVPTLLEDVPDMAVKFAVYESLRPLHARLTGRPATTLEDLCMGGAAGAVAAAATTPLDVVKTRMMCSASTCPTLGGAVAGVLAEGRGLRAFFSGVGPRALSNGINSAVFFCFFESIRRARRRRRLRACAPAHAARPAPPGSPQSCSARSRSARAGCLPARALRERAEQD